MQRRKFVRILLTVAAAPRMLLSRELWGQQAKQPLPAAAPVPWFTGLNPRTPLPATEPADQVAISDLKFFNPAQMRNLQRLCRVLMPPQKDESGRSKPGAIEAGTPEFLDFLLADSAPERQKLYAGGLDWLDGEAQKKYKVSFFALTDEQVDALVKPWLRTWMTDHPPTEAHADFVNVALDEIRAATINSKAWSQTPGTPAGEWGQTDLYWSPIEPDLAFVLAEQSHSVQPHVAAAKAQGTPEYHR
jgi:hypothetical protein